MSRLRPIIGALTSAAVCSVLQGAPLGKFAPDAGWLQSATILAALSWPIAAAGGLLLALTASREACRARGLQAGLQVGLGLYLAPVFVNLVPFLPLIPSSVGLILGWWLAAALWMRRQPAAGETGPNPGVVRGTIGVGLLAALPAVLGGVLAGPPAAIGVIPGADEGAVAVPPVDGAPNLVLIVLDTLRADRLSCYGYSRPTTPYLDELAANGLRYEHAVSPGCHTPPSHASLFTGLPPHEHGVMGTSVPLPDVDTIARRLGDQGYVPIGVISNFVIRRAAEFRRGFIVYDDSLVCPQGLGAASQAVFTHSGVGRLLAQVPIGRRTIAKWVNGYFRHNLEDVHAEDTNRRAFEHLKVAETNGRPFFLFLNYMDVHSPFQPPGEYMDRFLEHDPGRFRERLDGLLYHKYLREIAEEFAAGNREHEEELLALSDRYDGGLLYLDDQLRELVRRVEELSEERGYLIVITSDHGEQFGEHDQVGHGLRPYEEQVRVPLIVTGRLNGKPIEPQVIEEPVSLIDVPGTLLAAAGLREPLGRSRTLPGLGQEQLPTWLQHQTLSGREGAPENADEIVRFPTAEHGDPAIRMTFPSLIDVAVYGPRAQKAILTVSEEAGFWQPFASFDLRTDPREQQPLSQPLDETHPGLSAWQELWWDRYLKGRGRSVGVDTSTAGLGQLGYAEDANSEQP